jgi:hypothetical protein
MKIAALLIAFATFTATATIEAGQPSAEHPRPDVQIVNPVRDTPARGATLDPCDNDFEFRVQVQFYRTVPGLPGIYSVHGPYPFVRERVESGVRTLYYSDGSAGEVALATMTTPDGWEIIGDPSGLWDILTVIPNES